MTAGPAGAVHHHQFEQVPGPVRPKDQPADRVVADLVDGAGVVDGVVDVFARDAMAQGRAENLTEESYYETVRTAYKAGVEFCRSGAP